MNRLGIRNRVLVVTLVPLLVTAGALSSHFIAQRISEIEQELYARGQAIANQLAPACEYGLFSGNRSELLGLITVAAREPDVARVWITDAQSEIVAESFSPTTNATTALPVFTAAVRLSPIRIDDFAAAGSGRYNSFLGDVHVALSADSASARQRRVLFEGLLITLFALTLTALFAVRMSRSVTVPILRLTDAVVAIKNGHLCHRTTTSSGAELGVLERGINDMADALERARTREREHAADAIYLEQTKAQITLESIGEGVVTTDEHGIVTYINPQAERLSGWTAQEAVGRPLQTVIRLRGAGDTHPHRYPLERCLDEGQTVHHDTRTAMVRRDGSSFPVRDTTAPIRNRQGEVIGAVLVFHDFTEIKRMSDLLSYQATHDELTGLINRREFERQLLALLNAGLRPGAHALCYLDLDQFKVINDTCGHAAGDELLRQLSFRLSDVVRPGDVIARLGGDEFGIILRDCTMAQAMPIAETLKDTVRGFAFSWQDHRFELSVSIGVVGIDPTAGSLADLMSAADSACYVAKDKGGHRAHVYLPDDAALAKRHGEMQWVQRIHRAMAESRFRVYAQPIVRIEQRPEPPQYEVLLRMREDDERLISPARFIAAAERYQIMPALDRWVLNETFRALAAAGIAGAEPRARFNINLSGQSLGDEEFLDYVIERFESYAISPGSITFEVTETAAIANLADAIHMMTKLKRMGCRFALDDFGTGLSSFGYLQNLPIDSIKIDGNFVKDINSDPLNQAMVMAINDIGHVMGLDTIAESVEEQSVLEQLRRCGVDYAQGHCLGRPIPLESVLDALRGIDRTEETAPCQQAENTSTGH